MLRIDSDRVHALQMRILPLLREYACKWEETQAIGFFRLMNSAENADRMLEVIEDWIRELSVQRCNVRFLVDDLFGAHAIVAGPHTVDRLRNSYLYPPEHIAYLTQAGVAGPPVDDKFFVKANQTAYALGPGRSTNRFHPNLMDFFGI